MVYRNSIKKIALAITGLTITGTAAAFTGTPAVAPSQYGMSLHHELVTTANGAITTLPQASVNSNMDAEQKQVTQVADNVYRIAGWGIGNIIAVDAPDGWIVVDTGDNIQYASEQRAALEDKVGQSITVTAILYTHSHYVHGTKAWMDDETQIYGHQDLVANLEADNGISVLSGNFNTRAAIQFGMLHPTEGQDAFPSILGFGLDKLTGESGFLPPTITFEDNVVETHTIAGLNVEVLPSKTDVLDSVAFYFPTHKLLVSNAVNNGSLFNLYTLRGDIYRDPMRLVEAADLALARDIELHVDIHGPTHLNADDARQAIEFFRDSMQLIHDQTYRGISMGKDAQQIAEWIYLPADIRADNETYGQVESFAKQVYNARIGWMGWDVYDINPLPKRIQAQKTVEAMGGVDAVISKIKDAQTQKDTASVQWSLFLTTQLQNMGALEGDAKTLRANAARTLGQHTTSANARGFYISEALLHEGKLRFAGETLNHYQDLSEMLGGVTAEKLENSPLHANVQYLRFMVDTRLAEGKHLEFNLNFSEEGQHYAIALRNGIVAITEQPNNGRTFELTKQDWDLMLLGKIAFTSLHDDLNDLEQIIVR
jgi:alkyl sulfatase BDS1-like metallo-beta-lactamase superfamily hydrolase